MRAEESSHKTAWKNSTGTASQDNGSIEPKSGKSYIELEYDYALKRKKPFFAAVISDARLDAKVKTEGRSVLETTNGTLLQAFRERVT
jgi:hypothetical protein